MFRLVLLGAPGVGKGTQAAILARRLALPHISTGAMLREAIAQKSEIGLKVQAVIEAGNLVSDEMMISLVRTRLSAADCAKGFILDGFPRTIEQARALEKMLIKINAELTHVVLFEASTEELLSRLAHRRGTEDRKDDSLEAQQERLRVYEKQTLPLVEFYENAGLLLRVNAIGEIDEISVRAAQSLGISG